jgi:hypothetical protein
VIGGLKDRGWALHNAMATCIVASLLVCAGLVWLGPETRGRHFAAVDEA